MRTRDELIAIASETISITSERKYTNQLDEIVELRFLDTNPRIFDPLDKFQFYPQTEYKTQIEVTLESTTDAVIRLFSEIHSAEVGCLNFANGTHIGGGFLNGAQAQEEALCRQSTLYNSISKAVSFYLENLDSIPHICTNNVIYSKNIEIIRNGEEQLLDSTYIVDVITCPAINLNLLQNYDSSSILVENIMKLRIDRILDLFHYHNIPNLILGAFGCGAFGNNPDKIAHYFFELLETKYKNKFNRIVFAIKDSPDSHNYLAFRKELEKI